MRRDAKVDAAPLLEATVRWAHDPLGFVTQTLKAEARAAELTPPDASPEARTQVNRMIRIEHAQADRAWQAARGRAAVAAVDWLGKNPASRLLAMPAELRDGLSPEQTEALDAAAINGGRVVTDRDLCEALDGHRSRRGRRSGRN